MNVGIAGVALAVAVASAASFVRAQESQAEAPKVVTKTLVKSEAQKECFKLVNAQVLYYRFSSDGLLDFKLSHQEDKEIVHIARTRIPDAAGNFVAKKTSDYCLVWTNAGERSATLHYEIQRAAQASQ
jgi:hypothetical protein